MIRARHLIILLALALAPLTGAVADEEPQATFTPPYAAGPSGGDSYNSTEADPATGRATVTRAYPLPGPLGCAGAGGWATFQAEHTLTRPATQVVAHYTEAVIDPYTYLKVLVRDADGTWYGSRYVRGPVIGDGSVTVELFPESRPEEGDELVIQFGVATTSACPNVDAGTARFTSVELR